MIATILAYVATMCLVAVVLWDVVALYFRIETVSERISSMWLAWPAAISGGAVAFGIVVHHFTSRMSP